MLKELVNYLFVVCQSALNEFQDEDMAIEAMQDVINKYLTSGLYPTKVLVKAQKMLSDIVDCFDCVLVTE
jgi:hypothetical protein